MANDKKRVPDFTGSYRYKLDGSRRLMVPRDWKLAETKLVYRVILWPIARPEYLLVVPPERWQEMVEKLKKGSLHDGRVAKLERVLGSSSEDLTLDKVGRYYLPDHLSKPLEIGDEVQFVGRLSRFEIWSAQRFQAGEAEDRLEAAQLAKDLDL